LPFFVRFPISVFFSLDTGGLLICDIASLALTLAALESKRKNINDKFYTGNFYW